MSFSDPAPSPSEEHLLASSPVLALVSPEHAVLEHTDSPRHTAGLTSEIPTRSAALPASDPAAAADLAEPELENIPVQTRSVAAVYAPLPRRGALLKSLELTPTPARPRRLLGLDDQSELLPDQLYISGRPGASFIPQLSGVSLVINLLSPDEDFWPTISHHSLTVLRLPLPAGELPAERELDCALSAGLTHLRAGGRVLVYCDQGHNRAALVGGLLLREMLGLTGEETIERVQVLRPDAFYDARFATVIRDLDPKPAAAPYPS